MIVPIESSSSSIPEWGLLELNGELVMPSTDSENAPDSSDSLELGSLAFSDESTPVMIVGGHELKGSVVKLPRSRLRFSRNGHEMKGKPTMKLWELSRKKLLFDQYPKSIMR